MTYGLLAVTAGLAWFLIVNVAASAALAVAVRAAAAMGKLQSDRVPASCWFGLRLLPGAAAFLFVATMSGPAFSRFEPRATDEPVSSGLAILAALSLALIARGLLTACTSWRKAAGTSRTWMRDASRLAGSAQPLDVRIVSAPAQIVSLVGLLRPRLFISREVVESLTPEELRAVIAHEHEHRSAWDNLKRLAVVTAPDALGRLGAGVLLEGLWVRAVEREADNRAVGGDAARGLALASALLKVARLMPQPAPLAVPVSNFFNGGPLAVRVDRLVNLRGKAPRRTVLPWLTFAAASLIWLSAASPAVLGTIHDATELLVRLGG